MAVEHGLGLVVVDNADDVDRLEAPSPPARPRTCWSGSSPASPPTPTPRAHRPRGSKFGLSPARRGAADQADRAQQALRMRGLHVHVGSQILDVEPFAESVAPVAALGEFPVYDLVAASAPATPGPTTRPRSGLPRRARRRRAAAPSRRGGADHRARAEHGRTAASHGLPGGPPSSVGAHHFRGGRRRDGRQPGGRVVRPALRGRPGRRLDAAGVETVTWWAATARAATSSSTAWRCRRPAVGDLLAVPATGAYCFTMANNYNGNRRIPVVFARERRGAAGGTPGDLGRPDGPGRGLTPVRSHTRSGQTSPTGTGGPPHSRAGAVASGGVLRAPCSTRIARMAMSSCCGASVKSATSRRIRSATAWAGGLRVLRSSSANNAPRRASVSPSRRSGRRR